MTKLLGISGALRKASTNTKLVHEAARLFEPSSFEIGNLRLPLYDGDLESEKGIPPEVITLTDQIKAADAIVISTPEYNGNLSGVLKNALDWISRVEGKPLAGKPVAVLSAAGGRSGGTGAQVSLRTCLTPLFPRVLPGPVVGIAASHAAFDENGRLKDEAAIGFLTTLMQALRAEVERLA